MTRTTISLGHIMVDDAAGQAGGRPRPPVIASRRAPGIACTGTPATGSIHS